MKGPAIGPRPIVVDSWRYARSAPPSALPSAVMAWPGSDLVGRVLGDRYRLVALVGVGASAQVYLADDISLRRRVAIKILHEALADDATFLRRFRAEAQAAAQLHHSGILVIHDWNDGANALGGPPYIVTEYLEGGSLRALLDLPFRLSPSQALVVGLQAARALEHAHSRGFVHRDIKPANLLFDGEGRVRIGDFGLARALAEAAWTEPSGAMLGTARYAAPEQARGASVDGKADVYALAMVLHEAVMGAPAYAADTTIATLMRRLEADYEPPAELDALVPPLRGAGRLDPLARSDAATFVRDLEAAARQLPRPMPRPTGSRLSLSVPVGSIDAPEVTQHGVYGRVGEPPAVEGRVDEPPAMWGHAGETSVGEGRAAVSAVSPAAPVDSSSVAPVDGPPGAAHERLDPVTEIVSDTEPLADQPGRLGGMGDDPRKGRRRPRRWPKRVLAVVVALVVVGAGALGGRTLWRRSHPPMRSVPVLVGRAQAVARAGLAERDLTAKVTARYDESVAPGQVLAQYPAAGTAVKKGSPVGLTVSRGPAPRAVPQLSGLTLEAATAALTDRGLVVGAVSEQRDQAVAKGLIIDWSAKAGVVARGTAVDLVVSAGKPLVAVPNVSGEVPAAAKSRLESLGLKVRVANVFHPTIALGRVVATNYKTGTELEPGSAVTLRISKGPELVAIPDVRGSSTAAAEATLKASGFSVAGVEGSPSSAVTLTRPAPNTKVRPGTSVTLIT